MFISNAHSLLNGRDAPLPNSLVRNALADYEELKAEKNEEAVETKQEHTPPADSNTSNVDAELRAIADQLDVCIKIVGCGGGGSNTINRCVDGGIDGAQLCALNTDAKHLLTVRAPRKILIGRTLTRGLGAGAIPQVGEQAARENDMEIRDFLNEANIVFLTAGMGGGTGTGSAHYVARIAKEQFQALTLGVVTLPFKAEGALRMENALMGLNRLRMLCDTTIVIPNDKLLELVPKLPVDAAFKVADEVLMQTLKGLTEIITKPGLVNLDYSDIQTVMKEGGVAFVGIGEADDNEDDRVSTAVNEALSSPLLGEIDLKDAQGALIRVVGGPDMTVSEAERAADIVSSKMNERARIIWGCSVEPDQHGTIRILLIITGAKSKYLMGSGYEDISQPIDGMDSPEQSYSQQRSYSQDDGTGIDFVR
jgi:cell division protein FtsZ